MPILRQWNDLAELMPTVEEARRDVVTVGVEMVTEGLELDHHSHRKSELLLGLSGVFRCEVEGGIWIVPPQCALWVPGGMVHRIAASGNIDSYAAFVQPAAGAKLPTTCCTITVSPLLRELIVRSAQFPADHEADGVESGVAALLLHEVSTAPLGNLHLPMPTDPRLRSIFQDMITDPADRGTLESWAKRSGLSVRSLERVIAAETGMSFGRWRQQLSIILSVQWLASGASVKQVAGDLGYENVSSFVTMFRKALGVSPARYMAERSSRH
ncbi:MULTISPECIES: helix-turn-helix transcriptional regulator [unclassified Mesorhizobium]|uniref:AraC family transcriptional regulator n=1 Tax=unclassified Mesorhizobium TaxID=325217 RepID=UPI001FE00ED0|nr:MULTISPECIES: helix-turn-helix transcriptional regulator [unclassified Mesorhizobium]